MNPWQGMHVLITGVCGTIGRELLRQVVDHGADEAIGIDNNETVNSRVLGRESDLPLLKEVHDLTELWVTFRPDHIKRHRLHSTCEELGITLYFLADMEPFATADADLQQTGHQADSVHDEASEHTASHAPNT